MPAIDCITGESTLKEGNTSCRIGMIRDDGSFIIRELQNSFRGVTDRVRGNYDASLQGINSSRLLGTWNARTIIVPEGGFIFVSFSLKSKFMMAKRTIDFALRVSEASPMMQIQLPIITSTHSSLTSLPIVGRFELATSEELKPLLRSTKNAIQLRNTIEFSEAVEEGGMEELWAYLSSPANDEGDTLFILQGNSERERYLVDAKFMAGGDKAAKKKLAVKHKAKQAAKTAGGVSFAARKRKLKRL